MDCGVVDMANEDVDPCLQPTIRKLIMKIRIKFLYALPRDREEVGLNPKNQQVIDYNPRSCKAV